MAERLIEVVMELTGGLEQLTRMIWTKNIQGELQGAYGFGWETRDGAIRKQLIEQRVSEARIPSLKEHALIKVYWEVTPQSIVQTLQHPDLPQKQEMPSSRVQATTCLATTCPQSQRPGNSLAVGLRSPQHVDFQDRTDARGKPNFLNSNVPRIQTPCQRG